VQNKPLICILDDQWLKANDAHKALGISSDSTNACFNVIVSWNGGSQRKSESNKHQSVSLKEQTARYTPHVLHCIVPWKTTRQIQRTLTASCPCQTITRATGKIRVFAIWQAMHIYFPYDHSTTVT